MLSRQRLEPGAGGVFDGFGVGPGEPAAGLVGALGLGELVPLDGIGAEVPLDGALDRADEPEPLPSELRLWLESSQSASAKAESTEAAISHVLPISSSPSGFSLPKLVRWLVEHTPEADNKPRPTIIPVRHFSSRSAAFRKPPVGDCK